MQTSRQVGAAHAGPQQQIIPLEEEEMTNDGP